MEFIPFRFYKVKLVDFHAHKFIKFCGERRIKIECVFFDRDDINSNNTIYLIRTPETDKEWTEIYYCESIVYIDSQEKLDLLIKNADGKDSKTRVPVV
jgi:hypothetical protein